MIQASVDNVFVNIPLSQSASINWILDIVVSLVVVGIGIYIGVRSYIIRVVKNKRTYNPIMGEVPKFGGTIVGIVAVILGIGLTIACSVWYHDALDGHTELNTAKISRYYGINDLQRDTDDLSVFNSQKGDDFDDEFYDNPKDATVPVKFTGKNGELVRGQLVITKGNAKLLVSGSNQYSEYTK